ncbi:MAG: D-Ala-D-Ala carboxypeptidase family metallohydrolase [Ignavibacteria bacterium]|nr:D-Ala-D-Ala carboxypeptidase family metallohydrolase [Ignavibacteria bacterium]
MFSTLLFEHEIINFTASEVLHGNAINSIPANLLPNIFPTLQILQKIRTAIKTPIIINSTFRTKEHNLSVGGKPNSLHLVFNEIDFSVPAYTRDELVHLHSQILTRKFAHLCFFNEQPIMLTPNLMGIGLYKTFIHIDTRGLLHRPSPALWLG